MATRSPAVTPLAYPNLRQAAAMLAVEPSVLSRQRDLEYIRAGREHRVPAGEVLRLAQYFRRRSLEEVAFELVAYCQAHAPAMEGAITAEVDKAVVRLYKASPAPSAARFLRDARQLLPTALFSQVANAVLADDITATKGRRSPEPTRPSVTRRAAASGRSNRTASKGKARQPA
jgi:hypothetical protein